MSDQLLDHPVLIGHWHTDVVSGARALPIAIEQQYGMALVKYRYERAPQGPYYMEPEDFRKTFIAETAKERN